MVARPVRPVHPSHCPALRHYTIAPVGVPSTVGAGHRDVAWEGIIAGLEQKAAAADRVAAAHAALRADPSIQFTLVPSPKPPEPPEWLKALGRFLSDLFRPIGRFLRWLTSLMPDAPYARILLWGLIAVIALALIWMIVERLRSGEWRLPKRRRTSEAAAMADDDHWAPDAAPARAWLAAADRLAAEGRFAEAIHYLLFHSIDDIARRRPALRRPSLTSRELASASLLPSAVRPLFASIAVLVERSLFGGRPVGLEDWEVARAAYADLALPQRWRA